MKNNIDWSLYLVTDRSLSNGRQLDSIVYDAIKGGVSIVQIREKKASTSEFLALTKSILAVTRELNVPLIINDRIDIALAAGADGVHLGQSDMPYEDARRLLGDDAIIGISVTNVEQALKAEKWDVDYLGIGPIFFTTTKEDLKTPIGFEGFKAIRKVSRHPLIAIGGIKKETAQEAMLCGAQGIAVVSAIVSADSPQLAAQELLENVRK